MLKFYISFWEEYKTTLLDGKLTATNPESEYSLACSRLYDKEVYAAYNDTVIPVTTRESVAVNVSAKKSLIIKNAVGKNYKVVNCMGQEVSKGVINSCFEEIKVPTAGIIFVN